MRPLAGHKLIDFNQVGARAPHCRPLGRGEGKFACRKRPLQIWPAEAAARTRYGLALIFRSSGRLCEGDGGGAARRGGPRRRLQNTSISWTIRASGTAAFEARRWPGARAAEASRHAPSHWPRAARKRPSSGGAERRSAWRPAGAHLLTWRPLHEARAGASTGRSRGRLAAGRAESGAETLSADRGSIEADLRK